jgi:hypothetical protein
MWERCGGVDPNRGHVKPDDFGRSQNMLGQIVEYWLEAVVPPGGGDATVEPAAVANPQGLAECGLARFRAIA